MVRNLHSHIHPVIVRAILAMLRGFQRLFEQDGVGG